MVDNQNLDLGIIFKEALNEHPRLKWRKLYTFHPYIIIANYLVAEHNEIPYELLKDMDFASHFQYGSSASESIKEAEGFLKRLQLPYKEIVLHDNIDASFAAVEAGEGFTVSPPMFQHIFFNPYVRKYPLPINAEIGCIYSPSNKNDQVGSIVDSLARLAEDM